MCDDIHVSRMYAIQGIYIIFVYWHLYVYITCCIPLSNICVRADSLFAPSQLETSLQSNAVSHCVGANLESALCVNSSPSNKLPDITVIPLDSPFHTIVPVRLPRRTHVLVAPCGFVEKLSCNPIEYTVTLNWITASLQYYIRSNVL